MSKMTCCKKSISCLNPTKMMQTVAFFTRSLITSTRAPLKVSGVSMTTTASLAATSWSMISESMQVPSFRSVTSATVVV